MSEADAALALGALVMLALRGLGMALAGALRADHPFINWAAMVSQATLAALVTMAVVAPSGALAGVPLPARLGGVVAGVAALLVLRGRLLPALGCGLGVMLLVRWACGPG